MKKYRTAKIGLMLSLIIYCIKKNKILSGNQTKLNNNNNNNNEVHKYYWVKVLLLVIRDI